MVKAVLSGTWAFTDNNANITNDMNILSISPDVYGTTPAYNKMYIVVNMPTSASNANRIFINETVWSSPSSWVDNNINTKLRAADLKYVYMINATDGYAAGADGTLLKTGNAGVNWVHLATNINITFTKMFFTPSGANGMALGANGLLYTTTTGGNIWIQASAVGTYNDFSIYDKTGGKGLCCGQ